MYAVLRGCGRSDATVPRLLDEIDREDDAQGELWPRAAKVCLYGTGGALLGGLIGAVTWPTSAVGDQMQAIGTGIVVGAAVGCVVGSAIGIAIGSAQREAHLMKQHRSRVNDLIRRVNRAIASPS
jgi:hypothetical protein